jgi:hypothetical protein
MARHPTAVDQMRVRRIGDRIDRELGYVRVADLDHGP